MPIQKLEPLNRKENSCKWGHISCKKIVKDLKKGLMRTDHVYQREIEQWTNAIQSDFIANIIHGFPIPPIIISIVYVGDFEEKFVIDGNQRTSTIDAFMNDTIKLSKNTMRPIVKYQVKSSNGFETVEFDLRGKKYSDLPDEIKDMVSDYSIPTIEFPDSSDEEIQYLISCYNNERPMNMAQKGITYMETHAGDVKRIADMDFFSDFANFGKNGWKNGAINRCVVETIMATYFLDQWNSSGAKPFDLVEQNATDEMFETLEKEVAELNSVMTSDLAERFNARNCHLWLALFHDFCKMGIPCAKFADFLREFDANLHDKKVGEFSFDDYQEMRNTKDKKVVSGILETLKTLMKEFFAENTNVEDDMDPALKGYIDSFTGSQIVASKGKNDPVKKKQDIALESLCLGLTPSEVIDRVNKGEINENTYEDTLLYLDQVEEWCGYTDGSRLFVLKNLPALVGVAKYTYEEEGFEDFAEDWIAAYTEEYDMIDREFYDINALYNDMIDSLKAYKEKELGVTA